MTRAALRESTAPTRGPVPAEVEITTESASKNVRTGFIVICSQKDFKRDGVDARERRLIVVDESIAQNRAGDEAMRTGHAARHPATFRLEMYGRGLRAAPGPNYGL
jgi:hypothetical protein